MAVSATFPEQAAELCRKVCPDDLAGLAVYAVPLSLVAADSPGIVPELAAYAVTSYTLDLELRPILERRGIWQGRGFATVLKDQLADDDHDALQVTLHELAHFVERDPRHPRDAEDELPATTAAIVAERRSAAMGGDFSTGLERDESRPAWAGHEAAFIRAAVHVWHRARLAGFDAELPAMLVAGRSYGLSDPHEYAAAIGDEPAELASFPLWPLASMPMPERFTQLFARDTHRWLWRRQQFA